MRYLAAVLASAVLLVASCASEADDTSIAEAAVSLNAQSQSSLGVSIRALQFVFAAGPGTYLLKDSLVQDGSWIHLQELERAGYIEAVSVATVEGDFVQIQLTAKGEELQHALAGP